MSQGIPEQAAPSVLIGRPLRSSWAVAISVGAHVLLLGTFVVLSLAEPAKLEPTQKPVAARLVRLGQKRDPKLLPRREAAPPPAPPKAIEVPVPNAPPVPAKAPPTGPTSRDAKPTPAANRSRLFDAFAKNSAPADVPEGDPDGDPDGDSDSATEGERYFGLILAKARRNYGVTKTIPLHELAKLKATVILYIGPTGDLIKDPELQKSSGNPQFDQDVLLALRKAAPFGPPPSNLAKTLRTVGVAIEAQP